MTCPECGSNNQHFEKAEPSAIPPTSACYVCRDCNYEDYEDADCRERSAREEFEYQQWKDRLLDKLAEEGEK